MQSCPIKKSGGIRILDVLKIVAIGALLQQVPNWFSEIEFEKCRSSGRVTLKRGVEREFGLLGDGSIYQVRLN